MRYLGIDYGSKRVGIALSDEEGTMGFPKEILAQTPHLVKEVGELIAKEHVSAIVIGDSKNFEGGDNPIAKEARTFGDTLKDMTGLPVFYESEVFTSAEARRAPQKVEKSRSPASHEPVDASAAALILTSYLSRRHG